MHRLGWLWIVPVVLAGQVAKAPAFPGAEGFGASTPGGRGGDVYHVVNLNDAGPGSLRYGIQDAKGPRTIVFDVSGTIQLASNLDINKPFLTLAGQSAPGDGITLAGWTVSVAGTHDVIVRYLRVRTGDVNCPAIQGDSLDVDRSTDVILDHVSASWSIDEALSVTDSDRVTVQWSFITESLNQSCHEKGEHGYGSLLRYGNGGLTFHHNLYAHNHSRNPRVGDEIRLDFVNNVVYDYGFHGGEAAYTASADEGVTRVNWVGNFTIAGPSTDASRRSRTFLGGSTNTQIYQTGNLIDGNVNGARDGKTADWTAFAGSYSRQGTRFDLPQVATEDAAAAYARVLASAGASFARDAVDRRLKDEVERDGGATINSQKDVGGWPKLASGQAALDTDQDGIPDAWEIRNGLDPKNAADGAAITASGYSNLERYLNDLVVPKPAASTGTVLLNDKFADGNSQNQDLANQSVWLYNGRTNNIRTDQPGSVTFDMTPAAASSEAVWAFFTPSGSPLVLGVGDQLTVAVTFSLSGFAANGQDIRWGVLDSQGSRNTTNLAGGMNDSTFLGDPGYGLQFYASGAGSPFVLGRRTVLASANVFNSFGDFATVTGSGANERQSLKDDTVYTLTYSIERLSDAATRLTAAVTGGDLANLNYSGIESSPTPATTFDYFAFRVAGTNFARKLSFTELLVTYLPAPPVITSQVQPSVRTVQVGSAVTMAIGASGSALAYQWQKDGAPIQGNASARTATLALTNVQLADAGVYTVVVSNAGGSVTSRGVTLRVSTTPVPPAPAITTQPANTSAAIGSPAYLAVVATGDDLFYQWFKGDVLIAGATTSTLAFQAVQSADTGSYAVVVSNPSGSIASTAATLLVTSTMKVTGVSPWPGYTNLCADAPLAIEFDQAPRPGKSGRIRVENSAGETVDVIDMSASPQTRTVGGIPFSYLPVIVEGNRATISLHRQLPYNDSYTVTVEPGVFVDATGAPYEGLMEPGAWRFRTRPAGPAPGTATLEIASDGSGDFCTVQGAIDFVPQNNTRPVTLLVRPGVYTEIVYIPSTKPFITVRGDDREKTVIQYANNNNLNPSTQGRPVFGVDAADFTVENLTIVNLTPKGGSQAEAFRGNAERIVLSRINLKSYQDTLLLQGKGFITDSYIEGDVDFLWGAGTVFIQNSELKGLSSGGYYTQIRNPSGQSGYVLVNDRLTSATGVTGMYLSRIDPGVFPYSQVVLINCAIGPHIAPVGWLLNNATAAPTVQFWEYGSRDLAGGVLDVGQRAPFSRQLTAQEAAQWSTPQFVLGWKPAGY